MNDSGASPSTSVTADRSRSTQLLAVSPAREVCDLYEALAEQPTLVPGPLVDGLFGRLVELAVALGAHDAARVLADPDVQVIRPRLQRLCAAGETELERLWARRIAESPRPADELERFPYTGNYRLLIDLEWSTVLGAAGRVRPQRVAFIGGGPLPLSPVLLALDHGVAVDCFDRDPEAVDQARAVVAALGVAGVRVEQGDTARCPDLTPYDLVVLAALVGDTPAAKRAAVRGVHERMRPGALLAARSAHAARSLLYPVLDLEALGDLDLLAVVHPFNQVINSIVLARTRAAGDRPRPSVTVPIDEVSPWLGC